MMAVSLLAQPRLIHALPGRVRIQMPGWSGAEWSAVEECLRRVAGVLRVQANPLTGNVLIFFDNAVADHQTIMAMVRAFVVTNAGTQAGSSALSTAPYPHVRPRNAAAPSRPLVLVQHQPLPVPTSRVTWRRLLDLPVLLWVVKGASIVFSLILADSPLGLIACATEVLHVVGEAVARRRNALHAVGLWQNDRHAYSGCTT